MHHTTALIFPYLPHPCSIWSCRSKVHQESCWLWVVPISKAWSYVCWGDGHSRAWGRYTPVRKSSPWWRWSWKPFCLIWYGRWSRVARRSVWYLSCWVRLWWYATSLYFRTSWWTTRWLSRPWAWWPFRGYYHTQSAWTHHTTHREPYRFWPLLLHSVHHRTRCHSTLHYLILRFGWGVWPSSNPWAGNGFSCSW